MKYIALLLLPLLLLFPSENATAANNSPYQVIESTGDKLFSRIAQDQDKLEKFPELMRDIVSQELMPSVDHKYAAFKILGKNLRKTNKEQRKKFVDSMQTYLVKTYATALSNYKNQQVTYEPEKAIKKAKIVSVDAIISDQGKPDIKITFKLRKNKQANNQWQAFDMVIEGVSLLQSKQAEINNRIKKYGIDQVTIELAALKN